MTTKKSDLERWRVQALAIPEADVRQSTVPLHVLLGEAVDVAKFVDKYWEAETGDHGAIIRRGLSSAATPAGSAAGVKLSAKTSAEILSLQRATQEAHTAYLLTVNARDDAAAIPRARFLVNEMGATLEWLFDDGVEDEKDAQLANVVAAHADDPETIDALASELDDYAGLCEPYRDEMAGLGGFDVAFIDEAKKVAADLRARPVQPTAITPDARAALSLRNRVLSMLFDRLALVRSAARFVFRDRTDIVREATSAYERRRRLASKRAGSKKPPVASAPVPAPAPVPTQTG